MEQARSRFLSGGGRHAVLVDLPAGLPPVTAERRRIAQVLNNLFANAGRHAPESSPIRGRNPDAPGRRRGGHGVEATGQQQRGPFSFPHGGSARAATMGRRVGSVAGGRKCACARGRGCARR